MNGKKWAGLAAVGVAVFFVLSDPHNAADIVRLVVGFLYHVGNSAIIFVNGISGTTKQ
jgi:hypothetical protein